MRPVSEPGKPGYLCPLNCRVEDKSLRFALKLRKLRKIYVYAAKWWDVDDIVALMEKGVTVTRTL